MTAMTAFNAELKGLYLSETAVSANAIEMAAWRCHLCPVLGQARIPQGPDVFGQEVSACEWQMSGYIFAGEMQMALPSIQKRSLA